MNKISLFIARLLLRTLFNGTDYAVKVGDNWERGYIRFINIIWYPKEGWINSFHNFNEEDMKDLPKVLNDVLVNEIYGGAVRYPWGVEIQPVKKSVKRYKPRKVKKYA